MFQLAGAYNGVDFRNVFADLIAEALDEAPGDDELFRLASGLVRGHLEDCVDRLLLGAFDERAGIDDDHVRVFSAAGEFGAGAGEQAHHNFAVDQVFGAAQADEAHLLGAFGGRILHRILVPENWFAIRLETRGTANSEVLHRHAIFLF